MAKLVKMVRSTPEYAGGPTTAEVCEEAMANFYTAGWTLAEDVKKEEAPKVTPKEEPKAEPKVEAKPIKDSKKR